MKLVIDTLSLFLIVGARYFAVSGAFYGYFYWWKKDSGKGSKISPEFPNAKQIKKEIGWSMGTTGFFAVIGAFFIWCYEHGHTRIYMDIGDYGWTWYFVSLLLLLFLHDTYFYWAHRLMHHRWFFRHFHKVHHESRVPTPFASFSFHPLESFLEAIIVPALALVIPVHWTAYLIFLLIMTISGVVNHLGYEIFPRGTNRHFIGKWLINPTHHELHHLRVNGNYGLYFTWWDHWFRTQMPEYDSLFTKLRP